MKSLSTKGKLQYLFDKVAIHLLLQNKRSTDSAGWCRYRDLDDLRCAVGCLIEDEFYDSVFEGRTVSQKGVLKALKLSLGFTPSGRILEMLDALQETHDCAVTASWYAELENVARNFQLDDGVLDFTVCYRKGQLV